MKLKSKLLKELDIKITMGKLLEVERNLNINPFENTITDEIKNILDQYDEFLTNEVEPFNNATENKELNKNEKARQKQLLNVINKFKYQINLLTNTGNYELLKMFVGDELDSMDVTIDDLNEFREYYNDATKQLMIPKESEESENKSGKSKK